MICDVNVTAVAQQKNKMANDLDRDVAGQKIKTTTSDCQVFQFLEIVQRNAGACRWGIKDEGTGIGKEDEKSMEKEMTPLEVQKRRGRQKNGGKSGRAAFNRSFRSEAHFGKRFSFDSYIEKHERSCKFLIPYFHICIHVFIYFYFFLSLSP